MADPGKPRPVDLIFPDRAQLIRKDICVLCGQSATKFRDDASRREYTISGACQSCQDRFFEETS